MAKRKSTLRYRLLVGNESLGLPMTNSERIIVGQAVSRFFRRREREWIRIRDAKIADIVKDAMLELL